MSKMTAPPEQKRVTRHPSLLLLAIAYIGFVSLGLPDTVAGIAWPSVREAFTLSQSSFGLVFIALGCGYCASSFFGGKLTLVTGVGALLTLSSLFVAVAMFGSALAPVWAVFVACAVLWGLGSGGIDAGLNAYAASHFSPRHVNWLHACYSLGATTGPLLMTAVLISADSWRLGYALVGGMLLAMTLLFLVTRRRWNDTPGFAQGNLEGNQTLEPARPVGIRTALRVPLVWLHAALFFIYVGLEFTVGQWSFTLLTEARGMGTDVAGVLTGSYYGAIGVGRVLSGIVANRVGLDQLLRVAMLTMIGGAILFTFGRPVEVGCWSLALIGLGLAPVFPCLMAQTPERLGAEHAAHAVGFQVSAGMLGAALVPAAAGLLAAAVGLEAVGSFACLLAVLLFATHEIVLRGGGPARRSPPVL
jgi:fucose permease